MPEESFEQQARRKAEEFGMEPKPEVWLQVKAAIAPKERRRRVLIWWWLLPLCLAGGVGAWLSANRQAAPESEETVVLLNKKKTEKHIPHLLQNEKIKKTGETNAWVNNKDGEGKNGSVDNTSRQVAKREVDPYLDSESGITQNSSSLSRLPIKTNNGIGILEKNAPIEIVSDGIREIETDTVTVKRPDEVFQNSLPDYSLHGSESGQSLLADTDNLQQKKEKPDTTSLAAIIALPGKPLPDSAGKSKMKPWKKNWQIGVMAEAGVVSWAKGLLSTEKSSSTAFTSLPLDNAMIDSLAKAQTGFLQTKNGISAGAGFVIKKALSKRFYVSAQLGYRYQQYRVDQFLHVQIPQPNLNEGSYLVASNEYHSHFLSLGMNAGARLLAGKQNALFAEAGVDNGFIFLMQKKNPTQAGSVSRNNNQSNDFYRWQPQLSAALPFEWHKADKTRFRVSPFAKLGLRTFQKNGSSYKDNHLVSAGIQAVYFFR